MKAIACSNRDAPEPQTSPRSPRCSARSCSSAAGRPGRPATLLAQARKSNVMEAGTFDQAHLGHKPARVAPGAVPVFALLLLRDQEGQPQEEHGPQLLPGYPLPCAPEPLCDCLCSLLNCLLSMPQQGLFCTCRCQEQISAMTDVCGLELLPGYPLLGTLEPLRLCLSTCKQPQTSNNNSVLPRLKRVQSSAAMQR